MSPFSSSKSGAAPPRQAGGCWTAGPGTSSPDPHPTRQAPWLSYGCCAAPCSGDGGHSLRGGPSASRKTLTSARPSSANSASLDRTSSQAVSQRSRGTANDMSCFPKPCPPPDNAPSWWRRSSSSSRSSSSWRDHSSSTVPQWPVIGNSTHKKLTSSHRPSSSSGMAPPSPSSNPRQRKSSTAIRQRLVQRRFLPLEPLLGPLPSLDLTG